MILNFRICIPTYNNPKTLKKFVQSCLETTPFPILVVDDGSSPPAQVSLAGVPSDRLQIHRFETNQGKGAALRFAVSDCVRKNFTHMITMDADGQHLAKDVNAMVQRALVEPWDLIVGNREMSGEHIPEISKFGRKFSNFWVWVQTGVDVLDSQSGFRIYPIYRMQTLKFFSKHFDFEIEALVRLIWRGVKVQPVNIDVYYAKAGEHLSHFDKWWDNVRISWLNVGLTTYGIIRWPFVWLKRRKPSGKAGWSGKLRGGFFGNQVLKVLSRIFGLGFAYVVTAIFVVPYFFFFAPKAKRASIEYWRNLYGEMNYFTESALVVRHFYRFATVLLDRLYQSLNDELVFESVSDGRSNMVDIQNKDKGAFLVSAHLGAMDIAARFMEPKGYTKNMVRSEFFAQEGLTVEKIKGASSREKELKAIRQNEQSPLLFRQILESGKSICMMGDRPMSNQFELVSFLGKLAAFDTTPFKIAAASGTKVLYSFAVKTGFKNYRLKATTPRLLKYDSSGDRQIQLKAWAQDFADELAMVVRQNPDQWANFFGFWSDIPSCPFRENQAPLRCYLFEDLQRQAQKAQVQRLAPSSEESKQLKIQDKIQEFVSL